MANSAFYFLLPILVFSAEAFARAGGGRNEKCGLLCVLLYPLILIYAVYINYRINKKKNEISKALKNLLHPSLYPLWETQIKDHLGRGEKNIMAGVSIKSLRIVDVQNYQDNEIDDPQNR